MKNDKFQDILTSRIAKIQQTLARKADEYAIGTDRLHNFHLAAKINNQLPEVALWGMATKHLVSIIDIVNDKNRFDETTIDEKIGDMINYLILLEAILLEER